MTEDGFENYNRKPEEEVLVLALKDDLTLNFILEVFIT